MNGTGHNWPQRLTYLPQCLLVLLTSSAGLRAFVAVVSLRFM